MVYLSKSLCKSKSRAACLKVNYSYTTRKLSIDARTRPYDQHGQLAWGAVCRGAFHHGDSCDCSTVALLARRCAMRAAFRSASSVVDRSFAVCCQYHLSQADGPTSPASRCHGPSPGGTPDPTRDQRRVFTFYKSALFWQKVCAGGRLARRRSSCATATGCRHIAKRRPSA